MFDSEPPPAYPSQPPPPADESIRPMSYFGAALWVLGIHMAFLWIVAAVVTLRESASRDLVARLVCQIAAYCMGLFLMLRVHGPHSSIRRFVGLRGTQPVLVILGAVLGAAVAIPASQLLGTIEKRWPPEEADFEFIDLFFEVGRNEQLLIAVGVVLVGPFVEELLFRGALFGPMRQDKSPVSVVLVTSAFFALVHLDPRWMPPIFLVGLLLGYLRHASGSLLPSIALHAAFNAVPFVDLLRTGKPPPEADNADVPPPLLAGAIAVCALVVVGIHFIAKHSRSAQVARAQE